MKDYSAKVNARVSWFQLAALVLIAVSTFGFLVLDAVRKDMLAHTVAEATQTVSAR